MRRTLLAAVAAATLASPALAAPSSVTVSDPAGDWPVTSQDVRRVRLSSDGKSVTLAFELVAAPDATTRYQGYFATADYCNQGWIVNAIGAGTATAKADLSRTTCDPAGGIVATETSAATMKVRGTTVEVTAPYALGVKRGLTVRYFNGAASTVLAAVGAGMDSATFLWTGDIAIGEVTYRLR